MRPAWSMRSQRSTRRVRAGTVASGSLLRGDGCAQADAHAARKQAARLWLRMDATVSPTADGVLALRTQASDELSHAEAARQHSVRTTFSFLGGLPGYT